MQGTSENRQPISVRAGVLWVRTVRARWVRAESISEVYVGDIKPAFGSRPQPSYQVVATLPGMAGTNEEGFEPEVAVLARFADQSLAEAAGAQLVDALVDFADTPGVLSLSEDGLVRHDATAQESVRALRQ